MLLYNRSVGGHFAGCRIEYNLSFCDGNHECNTVISYSSTCFVTEQSSSNAQTNEDSIKTKETIRGQQCSTLTAVEGHSLPLQYFPVVAVVVVEAACFFSNHGNPHR
jgi:hypothetical protein